MIRRSAIFEKVPLDNVPRNTFNLTHTRRFSGNWGYLMPCMMREVLPGEHWSGSQQCFVRLAPTLAPWMGEAEVILETFFVPARILTEDKGFENFITGGETGTDETVWANILIDNDVVGPTINWCAMGTLWDYMGLPINKQAPADAQVQQQFNVSALPFRAYQEIYNEWYRDQVLQAPVDYSKSMGEQLASEIPKLLQIRKRAWTKDYFTSALDKPQKGVAVPIPMEGAASITYAPFSSVKNVDGTNAAPGNLTAAAAAGSPPLSHLKISTTDVRIENIQAIAFENINATINDLRTSISLQRLLEKVSRSGSRYTEFNRAVYGARSSDARLQRPEYLAGSKQPIIVSEVLSTFQDDTGNPQGTMAGHGYSVGDASRFSYYAEEHGFIITLASIIPAASYQQGIERQWTRSDRYDYATPDMAQIGEQAIIQEELFYDFNANTPLGGTFGYTPRFAEYKFIPDSVAGEFRTNLNYWTIGRIFPEDGDPGYIGPPALNSDFITCNPSYRIFAVTDESVHHFYIQVRHEVYARRPLPFFGEPGLTKI